METLSPDAVAALRFEIKGFRPKDPARRLPAYRELAAAGIMESVSETEYRFTPWGQEHREEILERESDRIEAGRMPLPDRNLSESARDRLRLHLAGDRGVTDENRPAYRELVAARVVYHTRPFAGGDSYRLTYWGYKLKDELLGRTRGAGALSDPSSPLPAPAGSPAPGG